MSRSRFERGAVLAAGLGLLLITTVLATAGIREATLELAKTGSQQAAMRAFGAAQSGLTLTLAGGGFGHTARRTLPAAALPDGTRWRAEVRFLGVAPLPASALAATPRTTEHAWHFAIEAEGTGPKRAVSRQRLQVYVPAEPPDDVARCLESGCAVPRRCADEPGVCPPPVPVAWHELEAGGRP